MRTFSRDEEEIEGKKSDKGDTDDNGDDKRSLSAFPLFNFLSVYFFFTMLLLLNLFIYALITLYMLRILLDFISK